jgi:Domain of unknown function (DUF4365)
MYVRALMAQAGVASSETSPGEDYWGIDVTGLLRHGAVFLQVKSGRARRNADGSYSVSLLSDWCTKWSQQSTPIYLVYVALARRDDPAVVAHLPRSTTWHAHAYWIQVNDAEAGTVRVPVQNRLTLDTFLAWEDGLRSCYERRTA